MSKYEAELKRRLSSGEPTRETRSWWIACLANEYPNEVELSPFEQAFDKEADEWWHESLRKTFGQA
jgi:hypothetical protein